MNIINNDVLILILKQLDIWNIIKLSFVSKILYQKISDNEFIYKVIENHYFIENNYAEIIKILSDLNKIKYRIKKDEMNSDEINKDDVIYE